MRDAEQIVSREIGHCVSYLVDNLYKLYWSEVSNRGEASRTAYPKPKAPDINFGEDEIMELYSDKNGEVFEHWIVSDWLMTKLREHGETVVEICNLNIWCRTTTGQQIIADHVIEEIVKELKD